MGMCCLQGPLQNLFLVEVIYGHPNLKAVKDRGLAPEHRVLSSWIHSLDAYVMAVGKAQQHMGEELHRHFLRSNQKEDLVHRCVREMLTSARCLDVTNFHSHEPGNRAQNKIQPGAGCVIPEISSTDGTHTGCRFADFVFPKRTMGVGAFAASPDHAVCELKVWQRTHEPRKKDNDQLKAYKTWVAYRNATACVTTIARYSEDEAKWLAIEMSFYFGSYEHAEQWQSHCSGLRWMHSVSTVKSSHVDAGYRD